MSKAKEALEILAVIESTQKYSKMFKERSDNLYLKSKMENDDPIELCRIASEMLVLKKLTDTLAEISETCNEATKELVEKP